MLLDFFLPRKCVHCDEPCGRSSKTSEKLLDYLCDVCYRQVELLFPPNDDDLTSKRALLGKVGETSIIAPFPFQHDGITQSIVHSFKYSDMPKLARYVGNYLSSRIEDKNFDLLLPIPLHRTRLAERGFNQAEMLAKGISETTGIPIAETNRLKRIKPTPSQTGLTPAEREENLRGAFRLTEKGKNEIKGKRILLVDDVMTTGATFASAAECVIEALPSKLGILPFSSVIDEF